MKHCNKVGLLVKLTVNVIVYRLIRHFIKQPQSDSTGIIYKARKLHVSLIWLVHETGHEAVRLSCPSFTHTPLCRKRIYRRCRDASHIQEREVDSIDHLCPSLEVGQNTSNCRDTLSFEN